ncbi:MAG TPA: hypothetical protein VF139_10605 [Candidatus Polarisedimenticolaceae bacterium]
MTPVRPSPRLLLPFLLLLAAPVARAWDPATRLQIVDEAIRFMPPSLRLALEHHRDAVRRGALEPMTTEDAPAHAPRGAGGTLDATTARAAADLVASVREPMAFDTIASRFGTLAHYVSDAAFPPGAAPDAGIRYAHFSKFAASRMPKFPLVFLGHEDADLDRGDVAAFSRRIAAEAAGDDANLVRAYAAAGDPPDPVAFDDRSVPFAIASLAYSRSVNYVVRSWLRCWRDAGGDLGATPYLNSRSGGR